MSEVEAGSLEELTIVLNFLVEMKRDLGSNITLDQIIQALQAAHSILKTGVN